MIISSNVIIVLNEEITRKGVDRLANLYGKWQ